MSNAAPEENTRNAAPLPDGARALILAPPLRCERGHVLAVYPQVPRVEGSKPRLQVGCARCGIAFRVDAARVGPVVDLDVAAAAREPPAPRRRRRRRS